MLLKKTKTPKWILGTLLLLFLLASQLLAGSMKDYSIGKTNHKNDDSFMQWGNLSGDTTDLKTFLSYDSLVLKPDNALCKQAAIAGFHVVVLYEDTAFTYELKSNKVTEEIRDTINKLPNVNCIIIENVRICCTVNGNKLVRFAKYNLTYTILEK